MKWEWVDVNVLQSHSFLLKNENSSILIRLGRLDWVLSYWNQTLFHGIFVHIFREVGAKNHLIPSTWYLLIMLIIAFAWNINSYCPGKSPNFFFFLWKFNSTYVNECAEHLLMQIFDQNHTLARVHEFSSMWFITEEITTKSF